VHTCVENPKPKAKPDPKDGSEIQVFAAGVPCPTGWSALDLMPADASIPGDNILVKDANGTTVGVYVDQNTVARLISGSWYRMDASPAGWGPDAGYISYTGLYFSGPDCTGNAYISNYYYDNKLMRFAVVKDNLIYYTVGPHLPSVAINSWGAGAFCGAYSTSISGKATGHVAAPVLVPPFEAKQ